VKYVSLSRSAYFLILALSAAVPRADLRVDFTTTGGAVQTGYLELFQPPEEYRLDSAGYRSTTSGSGYPLQSGSLLNNPDFTDNNVTNYSMYYYVVTAVDNIACESDYSDEIAAILESPEIKGFARILTFYYHMYGTDTGN
jgi:hypothetical protein